MFCGVISPKNAGIVNANLPISVNPLTNTLNLPNRVYTDLTQLIDFIEISILRKIMKSST